MPIVDAQVHIWSGGKPRNPGHWGTDITRMPCSWRQCVTLFTEELPWLTGRDRELVMGRAVCTWLGWKLA